MEYTFTVKVPPAGDSGEPIICATLEGESDARLEIPVKTRENEALSDAVYRTASEFCTALMQAANRDSYKYEEFID